MTWSHEIKNDSSEIRVVLIADILLLVGRFTHAYLVAKKARSF
jgi:hypothetical protein